VLRGVGADIIKKSMVRLHIHTEMFRTLSMKRHVVHIYICLAIIYNKEIHITAF